MIQKLYDPLINVSQVPQYLNISDDDDDDKKLFRKLAKYYQTKIVQIVEIDDEFKELKDDIHYIESEKGLKYITKLLKKYAQKQGVKWYNLKNTEHLENVKAYLLKKLKN